MKASSTVLFPSQQWPFRYRCLLVRKLVTIDDVEDESTAATRRRPVDERMIGTGCKAMSTVYSFDDPKRFTDCLRIVSQIGWAHALAVLILIPSPPQKGLIMAIVAIRHNVGKNSINHPDDVRKVTDLLVMVGFMTSAGSFAPRTAESSSGLLQKQEPPKDLLKAIERFQTEALWDIKPDGVVGPSGATLGMLNQLTNPLQLTHLKTNRLTGGAKTLADGGFQIGYKGIGRKTYRMPKTFKMLLQVSSLPKYVLVTGRPPNDLIDAARMPFVLKAIEASGRFAVTVQCKLIVERDGKKLSESKPKSLPTPVQPHNGKLLPLDEKNNGPSLTYQGNVSAKKFYGRTIVKIDGVDKLYFMYYSGFETAASHRGFDCTTYAGTVLGVPFIHQKTGASIRQHLGLSACTLKKDDGKTVTLSNASSDDIKKYFEKKRSGVFLLYKSSHVMLAYDNEVHEFTKTDSVDGYRCTAINTRLDELKSSKLTLCQATQTWGATDDKKVEKADAVQPSPSQKEQLK